MNTCQREYRWPCRIWLALILVPAALLAPSGSRAADITKFKFLYADKPDAATARDNLLLRPNVKQQFFVYLLNENPTDETVTVDVLAGEDEKPLRSVTFTAKAGARTFVNFAQPPEKPATDKAAAPPAEPALTEVKAPLKLRLVDAQKQTRPPEILYVFPPANYVEMVERVIQFDPVKKTYRLTVILRARSGAFGGPPCRVDLVLQPDRIPGLVVGPDQRGTRGGFLRAGGRLELTAEDITVAETGRPGLVYLTVDNYQRAFTLKTDFKQASRSEPEPLDKPQARLTVPVAANPAEPCPVHMEIDNIDRTALVELGLDRDNNGEFKEEDGEIDIFRGERKIHLFLNAAVPEGCLLLRPDAEDWSDKLDVKGIVGKRTVRLRVLGANGTPETIRDSASETDTGVTEIKKTLILDGSPPQDLAFVDFPKQLPRGKPLPVKAIARDPDSDIEKVIFFLGKPSPDGKLPPNVVPGKRAGQDEWVAALDAPTDQKGKLEVTVQATNGAKLTASDTVKIELVDAGPVVKLGTIEGDVVQGERPQPGIVVTLVDGNGAIKDTGATDKKGHYKFKDVLPGTYRVTAVKSSDNSKGTITVTVPAGETKSGVNIKLTR